MDKRLEEEEYGTQAKRPRCEAPEIRTSQQYFVLGDNNTAAALATVALKPTSTADACRTVVEKLLGVSSAELALMDADTILSAACAIQFSTQVGSDRNGGDPASANTTVERPLPLTLAQSDDSTAGNAVKAQVDFQAARAPERRRASEAAPPEAGHQRPHMHLLSLQALATEVALQTLSTVDAPILAETLGEGRTCELFAHILQTQAGRQMLISGVAKQHVACLVSHVLRCEQGRQLVLSGMSRPRQNELWVNIDIFPAPVVGLGGPSSISVMKLVRNRNICIGIGPEGLGYCPHEKGFPWYSIQSVAELTGALLDLQRAGVTDEEVGYVTPPMLAEALRRFPDIAIV